MSVQILKGDARKLIRTLPDESVHCVVTSPPYFGLRDYGMAGQIGLEPTPSAFVAEMVDVFREVRRVLRADGTLWLVIGDSYARSDKKGGSGFGGKNQKYLGDNYSRACSDVPPGLKAKDLIGIPWMVAFALRADGWYLRQDIIWSKPNPMPESVTDRCTRAHEYLFVLAKSGDTLLWRHRDTREWVYAEPPPDYVWQHRKTGAETNEQQAGEDWRRVNLWRGCNYYYDADAIAEPCSEATIPRLLRAQESDARANGVPGQTPHGLHNPRSRTSDKQRGHGRRHAGFNDRLDQMERSEQCGGKRNKRSVWSVATQGYPDAHFATFPPALIEPCIKAGTPAGGMVLDPFGGAGTTGLVADRLQRNAILIELNPEYADMADRRIASDAGMFAGA
ncbi:MAG: site-specific DNA-methyltransferase [Sulfuricaulis sp.]|nr:site-specific DNA-methyltransferase [Sulfuricaulis sp.]